MCLGLAKDITKYFFFSFLFLLPPGTDSSGSHGVMNQSVLTCAANRTWISFKIRSTVLSAHDFILYPKNISLSEYRRDVKFSYKFHLFLQWLRNNLVFSLTILLFYLGAGTQK